MRSKRSQEGYLLIDHRNSPGVPEEIAVQVGFNQKAELSPKLLAAGAVAELPTFMCSHCNTAVIMNPLRTKQRQWCSRCDHYICDLCAVVPECRLFKRYIDQVCGSDKPPTILL